MTYHRSGVNRSARPADNDVGCPESRGGRTYTTTMAGMLLGWLGSAQDCWPVRLRKRGVPMVQPGAKGRPALWDADVVDALARADAAARKRGRKFARRASVGGGRPPPPPAPKPAPRPKPPPDDDEAPLAAGAPPGALEPPPERLCASVVTAAGEPVAITEADARAGRALMAAIQRLDARTV